MAVEKPGRTNHFVGVCVVALVALALMLVALVSYVEDKLEQSGERQALALTEQAAQFAGELLSAGEEGVAAFGKIDTVFVFNAETGGVVDASTEEGLLAQPVERGASVYGLVEALIRNHEENESSFGVTQDAQARTERDIADMRAAVERKDPFLILGFANGEEYYVALAPVSTGTWYVCSAIPVAQVRAEADVVSAVFSVMFVLGVVCVLLTVAVVATMYRRQVREREMEMKTQLYEALSDSLEFAVNLYSPADDQVTPIVAKGIDIFGVRLEELIKRPELVDELGFSAEGARFFRQLRTQETRGFAKGEFSLCDPADNLTRYVEYTVRPLVYEGKDQVLVTTRDVTESRVIQLSMRDAMEAAEAANRAKSEFLSHMSHEIRTPMNVILGMLKLARRNVGDARKLKDNLDNIEQASEHLLDLINEVLDISKIESGKTGFEEKPFNLKDVVDSIGNVIEPQCHSKGQLYACKLEGPVDAWYIGDAMRVRQMLVNLLTNAVKYTGSGGHVRLGVSSEPALAAGYRRLTFVVSDDGIGMAPEYLEHLFEPFVMEGRSRSQGTGLGMPIVRNIVNTMGGDIHVETAEGEGTTVTVIVDKRLVAEDERFEEGRRAGGLSGAEVAGDASGMGGSCDIGGVDAAGPLRGVRVLLVEDNELNAEIARELLALEGAQVDWAKDGQQGLETFSASDEGFYDVILMDVQMPVMNGYEATRAIRELARSDAQAVPVIAMSANAFADDVLASIKSGMNAHLSKPIDMNEVVGTLLAEISRREGGSPAPGAAPASECASSSAPAPGAAPTSAPSATSVSDTVPAAPTFAPSPEGALASASASDSLSSGYAEK